MSRSPVSVLRPQEMIEGNFVERGGGSEGRNVAANAFLKLVGAHDHGQRIPAHQALDAALHFLASGKGRLLADRNRVLVRRRRGEGKVYASGAPGMQRELLQQPAGAFRTSLGEHVIERIQPFPGFKDIYSISLDFWHFRLLHFYVVNLP